MPGRDLRSLPKAELHLHLVGAMRPSTMMELRAAAGLTGGDPRVFTGFGEFQTIYGVAERVSDQRARRSLARAIEGKGAFRRFNDCLHQNYPDLVPAWRAFQSVRAKRRVVQWLVDEGLVDQHAAEAALASCADPDLP